MIHPQPRRRAALHELEHEPVDLFEHRRVFHPQRRELVHVEEAAVVDLFGRDAPVRQPVRLFVEQPIERVEAARLSGDAVEAAHGRVDQRAHVGASLDERVQSPLDHLFLPRANGDVVRIAGAARRKVLGRGGDALELLGIAVSGRARLMREPGVQLEAEHLAVRVGRDRQHVVETPHHERAVAIRELQLLSLEDRAVLIAENRNQHLVGELVLHRVPLDVEEAREAGARSVLEHVEPPGVRRLRNPHVIRHEIEHMPHRVRVELADPRPVVVCRAEVGVETRRVRDVVAVRTARHGLQVRRRVAVADAERVQVVDDRARVLEREAAVELQPISRDWNSDGWTCGHHGRKCKLSASATSAAITRSPNRAGLAEPWQRNCCVCSFG